MESPLQSSGTGTSPSNSHPDPNEELHRRQGEDQRSSPTAGPSSALGSTSSRESQGLIPTPASSEVTEVAEVVERPISEDMSLHELFCPFYRWNVTHRGSRLKDEDVVEHLYTFNLRKRRGQKSLEVQKKVREECQRTVANPKGIVRWYLDASHEHWNEYKTLLKNMCMCPRAQLSDYDREAKGQEEEQVKDRVPAPMASPASTGWIPEEYFDVVPLEDETTIEVDVDDCNRGIDIGEEENKENVEVVDENKENVEVVDENKENVEVVDENKENVEVVDENKDNVEVVDENKENVEVVDDVDAMEDVNENKENVEVDNDVDHDEETEVEKSSSEEDSVTPPSPKKSPSPAKVTSTTATSKEKAKEVFASMGLDLSEDELDYDEDDIEL